MARTKRTAGSGSAHGEESKHDDHKHDNPPKRRRVREHKQESKTEREHKQESKQESKSVASSRPRRTQHQPGQYTRDRDELRKTTTTSRVRQTRVAEHKQMPDSVEEKKKCKGMLKTVCNLHTPHTNPIRKMAYKDPRYKECRYETLPPEGKYVACWKNKGSEPATHRLINKKFPGRRGNAQ